jgi:hypothetical protein
MAHSQDEPTLDLKWRERLMEGAILALILVPAIAAALVYSQTWERVDWLKLIAVIVLSLFFPLLAYSFHFFRKERRKVELQRIAKKLNLDGEAAYIEMFMDIRTGPYFCLAAGISWLVAVIGLLVLFLGEKLGIDALEPFPIGNQVFPIEGSRLIFGMAFLGAYFWGVQYVFRRYVLNDLIPGVFFNLAIRMLLASTLALLIFNAFASSEGNTAAGATIDMSLWPAVAFLIGTFPQRGLHWLASRVPMLATKPDPSVRVMPVDMIEGIEAYDKMRLHELGIDSCHDLASADFIPLVLRTSYSAREVTDWILQAKLCIYCGQAVGDLRHQGIRGVVELADLDDEQILDLSKNTSASEFSLRQARDLVARDPDIKRLQMVAGKLSEYIPTQPVIVPDAEPPDTKPSLPTGSE